MNSKSTVTTHQPVFGTVLSITFGIATSIAGLINTFWGNDTIFGLFLITLSFAYFPFSNRLFTRITGIVLPWFVKVLLALFIVWVTLGVGEIFAKIGLMMKDLG